MTDLEIATATDLEPVEQSPFTDAYTAIETAIDADDVLNEINACAKLINDAESERDQFIEHYQTKIEFAKKICEDRTKFARDRISVLTEQLRRYAEINLPDNRKSIKLPSGTIGFSKQSPLFFFDDLKPLDGKNERLIHFVKHNAYEFLKVNYTESVDWQAFKSKLDINDDGDVYFIETGEIIDGLHAQRRPDKFTVKVPVKIK